MVFAVSLLILIVKGHVMELWWLVTVGVLTLTFVVLVKYHFSKSISNRNWIV